MNTIVTQWFNTGDPVPIECVDTLVQTFVDDVRHAGHTLCVSPAEFFRVVCQAVCVYYDAYMRDEDVRGPNRLFPKPPKWTESLESAWTDYLYSRVFPYTYWDSFWTSCRFDALDDNVHGLTSFLQTILPLYVTRDIQALLDHDIVFENVKGIVSWEEYDSHEDE